MALPLRKKYVVPMIALFITLFITISLRIESSPALSNAESSPALSNALVEDTIVVATATPTQMPTVAPGNPTSKGSGKASAKGTKSSSKGKGCGKGQKGSQPTKTIPTCAPSPSSLSNAPSDTFSKQPSSSPSVSLLPSSSPTNVFTDITVLSLQLCRPGCSEISDDAKNLLVEQITSVAVGGAVLDRLEVTLNHDSQTCLPCSQTSSSNRFLQDSSLLLASEIIFVIEQTSFNNDTTVDDDSVLANLIDASNSINEVLVNEVGIELVENTIVVATATPTQMPTVAPTKADTPSPSTQAPTKAPVPSPPPQELTTRFLAQTLNRKFNIEHQLERKLSTVNQVSSTNENERRLIKENLQKIFISSLQQSEHVANSTFLDKDHIVIQRRRRLKAKTDAQPQHTKDLYELSNLHESGEPFQCKCVDCNEDKVCGGLWEASRYPGNADLSKKEIHIVVSHCKSDLEWITDFTKGHDIASIHVISKCGMPVLGSPEFATIEVLPNVGRCDHTYAYYISTVLDQKIKEGEEDNSVVFFLKDDISANNLHQSGKWNSFKSMLGLASSTNGFGCGILPGSTKFGLDRFALSAYHEYSTLFDFSMQNYSRNIKGYTTDGVVFQSEYETLGSWVKMLGSLNPMNEIVQICYGGVFAASVSNIKKQNSSVWKNIEKSLSRGNNIQEGHYAERSWAPLMATPLQKYQLDAVIQRSDGVYLNKSSMHGALTRKPKLFIHIGASGTSSTEVLSESLIDDIDLLRSDGYNVAVHGKHDEGIHGFPNIDRFASCMWSDVAKNEFPEYMKEATTCPEDTLSGLSLYMERSLADSQNMIIHNPWLIHKGTAESLGDYLGRSWDVTVVIYYRRFYEWITIMFDRWRQELREKILHPNHIPFNSLRYIDFLREYCKRLFYGNDINEDGFPFRELSHRGHGGSINKATVHSSLFDPVAHEQFPPEELTDLTEYTYFAAKQYQTVSRFRRNVQIVNYHDAISPDSNLYCHVLHDASNACRAAIAREKVIHEEQVPRENHRFLQLDAKLAFKGTHALEEIAIGAYHRGVLHFEGTAKKFRTQIKLWIDMIESALAKNGKTISDLPIECLYDFEIQRLLEVSLAYEKILLPEFYASVEGASEMRSAFSASNFCSVDIEQVIGGSKWSFLFAAAADCGVPELPKVYIHVGAPKTGSTTIQDTMAMDRNVLREDNFYLALHGQVRTRDDQDYIIDNMLVLCDRLATCIWSEEERTNVAVGSGDANAGKCPDYLLPSFHKLLENASKTKGSVVISNEWFNRKSSETGLSTLLNDEWDPEIIIYYRRYFDWMLSAHFQWRFDVGIEVMEDMQGKVRFIDFVRTFCSRLFASKAPHFPDNADLNIADLTDVDAYTYHIWSRYKKVPRLEDNIKIVNFHDGHIVKSFYCDVLGAKEACHLEQERLKEGNTFRTRTKSSTMYHELAVGVHWIDRNLLLRMDQGETVPTIDTFSEWATIFKTRMTERGMTENNLPKECLSYAEQTLLLNVSLAYEKILLPAGYNSGGEEALREHFAKTQAKDKFCSVDLKAVANGKEWKFLFEHEVSMVMDSNGAARLDSNILTG